MKIFMLNFNAFLCFVTLSFSSTLLANCPDIFSILSNLFEISLQTYDKESWMQVKKQNFDHPYFSSQSQREHLYINGIIDKILDSNADLLREHGMSKSEIIAMVETENKEKPVGFSTAKGKTENDILIRLDTNGIAFKYVPHKSEAMVAAILAHEIIHIIKRHYQIEQETLAQELEKNPSLSKESLELELTRRSEIEADEMGFYWYVNAGYPVEEYKEWFLEHMKLSFDKIVAGARKSRGLSEKDAIAHVRNTFIMVMGNNPAVFDSKSCIEEGNKALAAGTLDAFMNRIKYTGSRESHTNECWRYWNIYQKEQELLKGDKKQHESSTLFFRIDLTNANDLSKIRKALQSYAQKPYEGSQLKVYNMVMSEILTNESLRATIVSRESESRVLQDTSNPNIVYLRAHDVFKDDMSEESNMLLKKHTGRRTGRR